MIYLNCKNHNIHLKKCGDYYQVTPHYFKDNSKNKEGSMGDILLDKQELAMFIVKLTELMHG